MDPTKHFEEDIEPGCCAKFLMIIGHFITKIVTYVCSCICVIIAAIVFGWMVINITQVSSDPLPFFSAFPQKLVTCSCFPAHVGSVQNECHNTCTAQAFLSPAKHFAAGTAMIHSAFPTTAVSDRVLS